MSIRSSILSLTAIPLAAFLAGCAGMTTTASPDLVTGQTIKGNVHGGQQPIVGSHVYLFQASTGGYGSASVSLLNASSTGFSDSIGAYVPTTSNGSFVLTGDYSCTPNTQIYLYALGGNPGINGTTNTAAGLLAGVGNCPSTGTFATTVPYVFVNEVSTVATAYALSGFATDATHIASNPSALSVTDLGNAFLTIPNLENIATGTALATTPAGNGVVPQATINTLANILSACINSTGAASSSCTTLFGAAKSGGTTGTAPTDTATAAINIAHNPGANVSTLYSLATSNPPFSPALGTAPNDLLLALNFNGMGASAGSGGVSGAYAIAIDAAGSVWITNVNGGSISKLSTTGAALSPSAGFGTAQFVPTGIAIDLSGNAWVTDSGNNTLTKYSSAGVVLATYVGGGLNSPQGLAIDSGGNVYTANIAGSSISEFNSFGVPLSPSTGGTTSGGYTGGGLNHPTSIAIDKQQLPWIGNQQPAPGSLTKFATNGTPISGSTGYMGGGISNPQAVAIDGNYNIWLADFGNNSVSEFNSTGTPISPTTGYTGGGLSNPKGLSIDGFGNVWIANNGNNTISEINTSGVVVSPSTGFAVGGVAAPQSLEVDGSGNIWIANNPPANSTVSAVTELVGAAVPKITPLSAANKLGTLAARP